MESGSKPKHVITATAVVPAQPNRVYAVIADYHNGHPHILPKQFSEMVVEKGGVGRGTIIRFQMSVFGRKQTFRAAISEPEPGRSEEHTSELQSHSDLVCRLLLEKKKSE